MNATIVLILMLGMALLLGLAIGLIGGFLLGVYSATKSEDNDAKKKADF